METFVIRVWHPAAREREVAIDPGRLRGIVEHVASRRSDTFVGPEALLALLVSALSEPAAGRPSDTAPPGAARATEVDAVT